MEQRFKAWMVQTGPDALEQARRHGEKTLSFVEDYYPEFVVEMRAYAEAAGIAFEDLLAVNADFDPAIALRGGCTDFAANALATADAHVYAVHNEDINPDGHDELSIVRVKAGGEPRFLAVAYGGLFPTIGFNEAGLSLTGNAVSPNDERLGLPMMYPPRKVLACRTLPDALEAGMPPHRGTTFNNIVCSSSGELFDLEGSATNSAILSGTEEGWLVHTNHYTAPSMLAFEAKPHGSRISSICRYYRARRLVRAALGRIDRTVCERIMRDHHNRPDSICRHPNPAEPPDDQVKSVFGSIIDLTARDLWVCPGSPCEGQYSRVPLRG